MADPILDNVVSQLSKLRSQRPADFASLDPTEIDGFVRDQTGGKYGLKDISGINLRNLGRSAIQGATMNFGDEILGKLPSWLGGGAGAEADMRTRADLFHRAHPIADDAAGIAGAVAPTLLMPEGEALTAGKAMARGAAVGAGVGAASGAGAGETTSDRLTGAGVGGAAGGVLGGLIPGLLAGASYLRDPAARAAARAGHAVEQSGGADAVRAKVADMTAAGRTPMLADASDHLRNAADFAATNDGDGSVLVPLAQKVRARQADASDRLLTDARSAFGGDADAGAQADQLASSKSAWAAGPNGYAGVRDANPAIDIAKVKPFLSKPTVSSAWKQARLAGDITTDSPLDQFMQKLMAGNPHIDPTLLRTAAKDGTLGKETAAMANASDLERPVTFDDMHSFRQIMDDRVSSAFRAGKGSLANAYKTVRGAVDDAMNAAVPQTATLDAEYARRSGLERALAAGQDAWNQVDSRGLAKQIASMPPDELHQFRTGMASELITKLRSAATNRDQAKQLVDASPALQDKLKVVFGNKLDDFMKGVNVEGELAKIKGAFGNSATARRLQSAGFDPAELGVDATMASLFHGPTGFLGAIKQAGAKATHAAVTRGTARAMGPMLMTEGQPAIEALLKQLAKGTQLVGRGGSVFAPAAAGRASSLFTP